MPRARTPELGPVEPFCSIERTLTILGDRWAFLVLRESLLYGVERFAEFQERLGIATNVLTDRLKQLVDGGVLERVEYREPGHRARAAYRPTAQGRQLLVVLGALQQWGDDNVPRADGPTMVRHERSSDTPVRVGFVRNDDDDLPPEAVEFSRV
ncbi:MAG: winged helix-turn-helix transcriptional regulator [Curtobacterium sp.]